jgi:ferric-dicitrate binding protein FerR (iron transport regulator)
MQKQAEIEKIERYINGEADDSEKAWVESQFLNGEDNYTLQRILKDDWALMLRDSSPPEVNLNHLLDRVHHIIRKNETLKQKKPLQKFIRIYMRAAAVLLFPVLIAGGLVYSFLGDHMQNTIGQKSSFSIFAPMGARVSFNLPDGTVGMLNSGSHLTYSLPFNKNRHIVLEGEAWFEINHDEEHPFEINVGTSTVEVLGTKFNMSAYPTEHYVEVVLMEGKVRFMNSDLSEEVIMSPSERLVFQDGQISRSVTDPAKYNAWTEGKLVFRGDPMAEVARRIERWYNVKVELGDKELEKYTFRATFQDDSLEEVLRLLMMTSPIRYQIIPRKLLPDGTFEKEKVIIYLKK